MQSTNSLEIIEQVSVRLAKLGSRKSRIATILTGDWQMVNDRKPLAFLWFSRAIDSEAFQIGGFGKLLTS